MMDYIITHNEVGNSFETNVDGLTAFVEYTRKDNVLLVTHTRVPKELEGRGIAGALTKGLLNYVRENDLKVFPICSYTEAYLRRYPEYEDIVENK